LAYVALKVGTVGPLPSSQDGDIVESWSDFHTHACYADQIRNVSKAPKNADGLTLKTSIAYRYMDATCKIKQTRTGKRTVQYHDRKTGEITTATIDTLPALTASELVKPMHTLFGSVNRWTWFGGGRLLTPDAELDLLWNLIEGDTAHRRNAAEYQIPPWALNDNTLRRYFVRPVDGNPTREQCNLLKDPHWEDDPDWTPRSVTERKVLIRQQRRFLDYENDLAGLRIEDVRDVAKVIRSNAPIPFASVKRKRDVSDDHKRKMRRRSAGQDTKPVVRRFEREEVPA